MPDRAAAPASAFALERRDGVPSFVVTAKRDEDLVEVHFIQNFVACRTKTFGEPRCVLTHALNQIGEAGAAQGEQGSPYFHPARAAGHFRSELIWLAFFSAHQIGSVHGHGGAQMFGVAHESDS